MKSQVVCLCLIITLSVCLVDAYKSTLFRDFILFSKIANRKNRETASSIFTILHIHNKYRSRVAAGEEHEGANGPQPSAANMKELSWDEQLANGARECARQCRMHHLIEPDHRFAVGQNIFMTSGSGDWNEAVTDWYEEVRQFDSNEIDHYQFQSNTGHYTQLVWATTSLVGCATQECGGSTYYVCNYGPAGNFIGQQVYEKGTPCSECDHRTHCVADLCGNRAW